MFFTLFNLKKMVSNRRTGSYFYGYCKWASQKLRNQMKTKIVVTVRWVTLINRLLKMFFHTSWCFQGVWKETSSMKLVNKTFTFLSLLIGKCNQKVFEELALQDRIRAFWNVFSVSVWCYIWKRSCRFVRFIGVSNHWEVKIWFVGRNWEPYHCFSD